MPFVTLTAKSLPARRLRPIRRSYLFGNRPTWAKTGPRMKGKTIRRTGSHPNREGFGSRPGFVFLSFGFEK
eukprot:scaffold3056_cov666-Pavlova_lutheri.AAC.2